MAKDHKDPARALSVTRRQSENARAAIQATKLIERLQQNAMGELKEICSGEPTEMTKSQVDSARILLDKAIPTLQAIQATVTNEESKTYEQILAELALFFKSNPDAMPQIEKMVKSTLIEGSTQEIEVDYVHGKKVVTGKDPVN